MCSAPWLLLQMHKHYLKPSRDRLSLVGFALFHCLVSINSRRAPLVGSDVAMTLLVRQVNEPLTERLMSLPQAIALPRSRKIWASPEDCGYY